MGFPGGVVFNPFWKPVRNFDAWLRKLAEGSVMAVAHAYFTDVEGGEALITHWDVLMKKKGSHVQVRSAAGGAGLAVRCGGSCQPGLAVRGRGLQG